MSTVGLWMTNYSLMGVVGVTWLTF